MRTFNSSVKMATLIFLSIGISNYSVSQDFSSYGQADEMDAPPPPVKKKSRFGHFKSRFSKKKSYSQGAERQRKPGLKSRLKSSMNSKLERTLKKYEEGE